MGHGRLFTTLKKLKLKPVDKVSQGGNVDYESLHGDECEDLLRGLWGDDGLLSTLARNTKTPRSNASVKQMIEQALMGLGTLACKPLSSSRMSPVVTG